MKNDLEEQIAKLRIENALKTKIAKILPKLDVLTYFGFK